MNKLIAVAAAVAAFVAIQDTPAENWIEILADSFDGTSTNEWLFEGVSNLSNEALFQYDEEAELIRAEWDLANEFLGAAGGCGLLRDQQEVDTYLVHRTTGMAEEDVEDLSKNLATIPNDRLESVIGYVEKRVTQIIQEFTS